MPATGMRWRRAGVVGGILALVVAAAVDFLILASGHADVAFVPTIGAWAFVLNRVGVRYRVASVRSWIGMTLVAFGTFAVVAGFAGCAAALVMYG